MTLHHPTTVLGLVPFTALQSRPGPSFHGPNRDIRQEKPMLTTIAVAGHITAQGDKIADHADGRVTISTGLWGQHPNRSALGQVGKGIDEFVL